MTSPSLSRALDHARAHLQRKTRSWPSCSLLTKAFTMTSQLSKLRSSNYADKTHNTGMRMKTKTLRLVERDENIIAGEEVKS